MYNLWCITCDTQNLWCITCDTQKLMMHDLWCTTCDAGLWCITCDTQNLWCITCDMQNLWCITCDTQKLMMHNLWYIFVDPIYFQFPISLKTWLITWARSHDASNKVGWKKNESMTGHAASNKLDRKKMKRMANWAKQKTEHGKGRRARSRAPDPAGGCGVGSIDCWIAN